MYKILFADDDEAIRTAVKDYFTANGFDVTTAENGEDAVLYANETEFDAIILDVMMPAADGLFACGQIRKLTAAPIIFLSALGEEKDYLKGYSSGADDYIAKPFPLSVLQEKCLSLIRRTQGTGQNDIITSGAFSYNRASGKLFVNGKEITLTAKDGEIVQYLMQKKGVVLSRELILSRVWGYDFEGSDRVVDTHIKNIRRALGDYAGCIKTVSGRGYIFEGEEE